MNQPPTSPPPLKGPLRLRDVFFSERTAPLTAHHPRSRMARAVFWIAGGLVTILVWYILRAIDSRDAMEILFAITLFAFVLSELAGGLIGASLTQAKYQNWLKQGRLSELYLTSLRPIEIGQLIIAASLGQLARFLWLVWGAFCVALIVHHPSQIIFAITMGVMVLNGVLSLQEQAWVGLTIQAGLGKGLRTVLALAHQTGVQLLAQIPLVMMFVVMTVGFITVAEQRGWHDEEAFAAYFHTVILVIAGPHWLLKWLFARAHAVRLERVVMPRLEL